MKKVLVAALAVALAVVMAVPASAFENEFGGYFRVRAYTNQDFAGNDTGSMDYQVVDTRTHLYYTAKFSDDFKFVNKFEIDNTWGEGDLGDIGADGTGVMEVKNTYVDYNLGNYNIKLGTQTGVIARGFVFWDDFSGATITGQFGDVEVPFYWMKINEGGYGSDANDADKDAYAVSPIFKSGNMTVNPYFVYVTQKEQIADMTGDGNDNLVEDFMAYDIGVDLDVALGNANAWTTLIYQGGSVDVDNSGVDISSYLVAFGGDVNLGDISVHGQMFHATGNDDDDEINAFVDIISECGQEGGQDWKGQSYYWAEIMGYGMFDYQTSDGSPEDKISNITAFNIGASMSPKEKLTVGADLWYAMLAEDNAAGDNELGTELDLSASYALKDNLNLDLVAAYLMAGDATGGGDENPMEIGAQLSLSF